jgi:hypothetical protein
VEANRPDRADDVAEALPNVRGRGRRRYGRGRRGVSKRRAPPPKINTNAFSVRLPGLVDCLARSTNDRSCRRQFVDACPEGRLSVAARAGAPSASPTRVVAPDNPVAAGQMRPYGPTADGDPGGRMRLRMRVHEVSRSTRFRRVLTPCSPLARTHLAAVLWHHTGALFSCRADLLRLGALFRLAATSPHSAVFLLLRDNRPAPGSPAESWARATGLTDLVVVRSDVPLPPSAWPATRARMRRGPHPGALHTMLAPAPRPLPQPQPRRRPDRLTVAEHADTVLLSGAAAALHVAGDELTACGNLVAIDPDIHRFGGPVPLSQFRGHDPRLHAGQRRDTTWECDILAEDTIFHRTRWIRAVPTTPQRRRSGRQTRPASRRRAR